MITRADVERERASRRDRVRGRGARIRGRDLDIVLALAKMRLLRTSDIARLFFAATGTCQKRMRKLFDAGLVRTVVTGLNAENRYALTTLGYAFLEQAFEGKEVPPFFRPFRAEQRTLQHLDLLNGYRIALALGASQHGCELRSFLPEWELRSRNPYLKLIPDALALLVAANGRSWHLAVEVDTSTESTAEVGRKLKRYEAAIREGELSRDQAPVIVLVTMSERRARSLLSRRIIRSGITLPIGMGSRPEILVDGGLTTGIATPKELAEGPIRSGAQVFRRGLLRGAA